MRSLKRRKRRRRKSKLPADPKRGRWVQSVGVPKMGTATKPGVTDCDGNPRFRGPKTGRQVQGAETAPQAQHIS